MPQSKWHHQLSYLNLNGNHTLPESTTTEKDMIAHNAEVELVSRMFWEENEEIKKAFLILIIDF
jgi:hypothetical protein